MDANCKAYGSNLDDSTFLKRRKQKPLKSVQARCPGYVLRFDLAAVPYQEPGMSGIRPRRPGETDPDVLGIAYLLTATEYERLLRSEGGRNGGYLEIDVRVTALLNLTTHPGDEIACKSLQTRSPREDPRPFPSKRYIGLIRTGAKAHRFPEEYQTYLEELPFYQVRGWRTAVGRVLFLTIWLPFILFIFALMRASESLSPGQLKWLRKLQEWTFLTMWKMHDGFFARVFGRGDVSAEPGRNGEGEK
jgi:gliotoxin/aspirochlorine biosynthesis gamma-glutamylcyclotransferase